MHNKLIVIIFILTVFDTILTYTGIKSGYIEEANPLLKPMFDVAPELTALFLIAFVGSMLYIICKHGYRVRYTNTGLMAIITIKFYVIWVHYEWIVQVI